MLYRTRASDWWNTYWRLGRKIEKQSGVPSANDVRRAALLMQAASRSGAESLAEPGATPLRGAVSISDALASMEWVIEYGKRAFEAELKARKAQALLDQDS